MNSKLRRWCNQPENEFCVSMKRAIKMFRADLINGIVISICWKRDEWTIGARFFSLGHYHVWMLLRKKAGAVSYSCQFKITIFHSIMTHILPALWHLFFSGTDSWIHDPTIKLLSSLTRWMWIYKFFLLWHYRRLRWKFSKFLRRRMFEARVNISRKIWREGLTWKYIKFYDACQNIAAINLDARLHECFSLRFWIMLGFLLFGSF